MASYRNIIEKDTSDVDQGDFYWFRSGFSDEEIDLLEFPRLVKSVRKRKQDIETLAAENGLTACSLHGTCGITWTPFCRSA